MDTYEQFTQLDIRVGTIIAALPFPEARIPAVKLEIDLGPVGIKRSCPQVTMRYELDQLVGQQVIAVVNFPPRRVAGYISEVLVLGAVPGEGDCVLLKPDVPLPNGTPIA